MIILSWLCTLFIARVVERTWWSPGALLALLLGGSAIATRVLAPEYYMSGVANLVLQGFVLATVCGSCLSRVLPERVQKDTYGFRLRSTKALFAFGLVVSLVSFHAVASSVGIDYRIFFNLGRLAAIAQIATRERYTEGVEIPLYGSVASACVLAYVAVIVMDATTTRRLRLPLLLPVGIFALGNAIVTTRSTLVYLLFIAVLAYVYARAQLSRELRYPGIFTPRMLLIMGIGACFLVVVFVGFQVMRFGESGARSISEVLEHLRRWPWGSLPGFSLWWDGFAPEEPPHLPGDFTFMGFYDNLGIEERTVGGYTGYVWLTPTEPANIYTSFRGLIHDFSLLGAVLFMGFVGFLGRAAMSNRISSRSIQVSLFFLIQTWILTSFIFSYWAFVGNVLAAVLIPLLMKIFGQGSTTSDWPLLTSTRKGSHG
ncbi:O-antigen polymerase [Microbacterium esteraromaticum]|uniref:O-antigen polymerase n=1 Tax=Microbacterium esteraromaticum TaxID=57043 RepID=UPI000B35321F|nr:O-antigen polymerase [Microbacterium esteraromaticum]